MEAQASLTQAFSSSAFFGLLFLIFLLTMPYRFRSGEFAGQSITPTNQNQIKSPLLSHHHSTSALVSEILTSVLQTVQKK